MVHVVFYLLSRVPQYRFGARVSADVFRSFVQVQTAFANSDYQSLRGLITYGVANVAGRLRESVRMSYSFALVPVVVITNGGRANLMDTALFFQVEPVAVDDR